MHEYIKLSCLEEGQSAVVTDVLSGGCMRRRLLDLGLIEGTHIQCLQKSPAGDPVAYAVRGAVIALRGEDSGDIMVSAYA